jgi:3D (Asp-Asp-Asp) domain-containing protein
VTITAFAAAATLALSSTAYCDQGTMANGQQTRPHTVAMNSLPLGSKIRLVKPKTFNGQRIFYVRDHIGWGSEIDFWTSSCGKATSWGRHKVTIKVLRRGK